MKIKNSIRTIYIKIDNKREKLEDFIADDILKRFDESKNAEQIREIVALAAVNALCAFAVSEGIPAAPAHGRCKSRAVFIAFARRGVKEK